jgi:diguanylate cyclase (GGDEF)-like protein
MTLQGTQATAPDGEAITAAGIWPQLRAALIVGGVVCTLSLFGILARPVGFLAAIWPANAVLLGLLVARPHLANAGGWCGALAGYLVSGVLAHDPGPMLVWLTLANLSGVVVGFALMRRAPDDDRHLRRPASILRLFLVCLAASAAAAIVGTLLGARQGGTPLSGGLMHWFATELTNYIIALPVLLAAPSALSPTLPRGWLDALVASPRHGAPLAALTLSLLGSVLLGGPGAVALSAPSLLWCALTYGLFPNTLIVFAFSVVMLAAQAAGWMVMPAPHGLLHTATSFSLGITFLVLGPLTVTSIARAQRNLLARLDRAATHDGLTGLLNRQSFLDGCRAAGPPASGVAVMMIDIDHFKRFNDTHGHATGDAVLVAVTQALAGALPQGCLLGRLGGEEFAVLLAGITRTEAEVLAARLLRAVEATEVDLADGAKLQATVSIGLVHHTGMPEGGPATLLPFADAALYDAKAGGRDQVRVAPAIAPADQVPPHAALPSSPLRV